MVIENEVRSSEELLQDIPAHFHQIFEISSFILEA